eukprot:9479759-Pyramimonas_sp.AAC.1
MVPGGVWYQGRPALRGDGGKGGGRNDKGGGKREPRAGKSPLGGKGAWWCVTAEAARSRGARDVALHGRPWSEPVAVAQRPGHACPSDSPLRAG